MSFGIDLGTTCSCFAIIRRYASNDIAKYVQIKTTPFYIMFTENDIIFERGSKNQEDKNINNIIYDLKFMIGRKFSDPIVQKRIRNWPFKVLKSSADKIQIEVQWKGETKKIYPEEIYALFLAKMKEDAEKQLKTKLTDAVVTVPIFFDDEQCKATKEICLKAGIGVLNIVKEPIAASIAFAVKGHILKENNILVLDLGGGSFSVSYLQFQNSAFSVLASAENFDIGGEIIDNIMVEYFSNRFQNKFNCDLRQSPYALRTLRLACEQAKIDLSTKTTASIFCKSIFENHDLCDSISLDEFEKLTEDMFKSMLGLIKQVLKKSEVQESDYKSIPVILLGRSSYIPKVHQFLKNIFTESRISKGNHKEAIAIGSAILAAIIKGETPETYNAQFDDELKEPEDKQIESLRISSIPVDQKDKTKKKIEKLLNCCKENWIEVMIYERLSQKFNTSWLLNTFLNSLIDCIKIRTPSDDSEGNLFCLIPGNRISFIMAAKFKSTISKVQSALAKPFGNLVYELVNALYISKQKDDALLIIKEIFLMSSEDRFNIYNIFFKRLKQIFYQSKKLLTVTVAPQIIDIYFLNSDKSKEQKSILSYEKIKTANGSIHTCKFKFGNLNYICEFSNKKEGKFFGSVIEIKTDNGKFLKKYYLKGHIKYPAYNEKGSSESYLDTIHYSTTLEIISQDERAMTSNNLIDLREPFMYQILDHLKYGPITHIIINPYIFNGLFIVTEDLNSNDNLYLDVDKFDERFNLNSLAKNTQSNLRENIIINFTETNILSELFNLTDLHPQNWGYYANSETYDQLTNNSIPLTYGQIRIVDFLIRKPSYSIGENILKGKIPGMKDLLSSIIGEYYNYLSFRSEFRVPSVIEKLFLEKIEQLQRAVKDLNNHFPKAFNEFIDDSLKDFKNHLQSSNLLIEYKDDFDTLDQELETYCQEVKKNYSDLNTFLSSGYKDYFNEMKESGWEHTSS